VETIVLLGGGGLKPFFCDCEEKRRWCFSSSFDNKIIASFVRGAGRFQNDGTDHWVGWLRAHCGIEESSETHVRGKKRRINGPQYPMSTGPGWGLRR